MLHFLILCRNNRKIQNNNGTDNPNDDTLSSWSWTIPEKSVNDLDPNKHYTYVVSYYTKVTKESGMAGYIGNEATESIASLVRNRRVIFPGIGTENTRVDKRFVQNYYDKQKDIVYTQWELTFDRFDYALRSTLLEDTLPHIDHDGKSYYDTFVTEAIDGTDVGPMVVTLQKEDPAGTLIEDSYQGSKITETAINKTTGETETYERVFAAWDRGETCVAEYAVGSYDIAFRFYKTYNADDPLARIQGLYGAVPSSTLTDAQKKEKKVITITFWTMNDSKWIDACAKGQLTDPVHVNKVHIVQNGLEADGQAAATPAKDPRVKKTVEEAGKLTWKASPDENGSFSNSTWTLAKKDNPVSAGDITQTLPIYRYTLTLEGMSDGVFTEANGYAVKLSDAYNLPLIYIDPTTYDSYKTSKIITKSGISDYQLVRMADGTENGTPYPRTEIVKTDSDDPKTGEALTITIAKLNDKGEEDLKYQPKDASIPVYGVAYEVSYYLTLDPQTIRDQAQTMVNQKADEANKQYPNTAEWDIGVQGDNPKATKDVTENLNPITKKVDYQEATESAAYEIVINPLKLTMNDGQPYKLEDIYENLAVDFETIQITCDPELPDGTEVEYSYHGNVGTYWLPDNTKVTIKYDGWPVGERGKTFQMKNTAVIMDKYSDESHPNVKLEARHEGSAATYRIRIFKFADDNMNDPLTGAVFQLFDKDKQPMTYKNTVAYEHPEDDDKAWEKFNGKYPTPNNHKEGDYIYLLPVEASERIPPPRVLRK